MVLGITGGSGVVYGVMLAEVLVRGGVELVVVVSDGARKVLGFEVPDGLRRLEKLARVLSELDVEVMLRLGRLGLMRLLSAHAQ